MNEPYAPPSALPQPSLSDSENRDEGGGKIPKSRKGTVEEEGGKMNAGKPSGLDKGALEMGGEAGGTHTSPGPPVGVVEDYRQTQEKWGFHGRNQPAGEERDKEEKYWSVKDRMEPHLQMM